MDASAAELFGELVSAYQTRDASIASQDVWELITRLRILPAGGRPVDAYDYAYPRRASESG